MAKEKSKREKFRFDVALSFAGQDRKTADKFAAALKAKGLDVFYDKDHFPELWGEGEKKFAEIYGKESRFVIPLVSQHYADCDYARFELHNARKRLQAGDDPDVVLQQFAHALSRKFMHHPTESLRLNHDEEMLIATRELFGLDRNERRHRKPGKLPNEQN